MRPAACGTGAAGRMSGGGRTCARQALGAEPVRNLSPRGKGFGVLPGRTRRGGDEVGTGGAGAPCKK
jgi:hypothetical protein